MPFGASRTHSGQSVTIGATISAHGAVGSALGAKVDADSALVCELIASCLAKLPRTLDRADPPPLPPPPPTLITPIPPPQMNLISGWSYVTPPGSTPGTTGLRL